MNRLLLFMFLLLSAPVITARERPFPTAADVEKFGSSVTCVVLNDSPFSFYNAEIREAVGTSWNLTTVRFISESEFDSLRTDPSFSFLILTESSYSNDKSGSSYNFLNLLLGADVDDIDEMPEFSAVPLSLSDVPEEDYSYKLGLILRFMQYHARLILNDPSDNSMHYLKYFNRNVPAVKDKTILICEEDLAPEINTPEKISVYYKNKIRIVSEEEIIKAVEEKAPDVLIFHIVKPDGNAGMCMKMLIGADDAMMYYYGNHLVNGKNGNGLLISDLKRLSRF